MIHNIKIVYDRERTVLTKKRVFVIAYSVIVTIFSIFSLIAINRVISLATKDGVFEFTSLTFLYERLIDVLYAIGIFSSVFFMASNISDERNNFSLDHILATDINFREVIIAKYISGLLSSIELTFSLIPIVMLSMFYGGIGFTKLLFMIILQFAVSSAMVAGSLFLSCLFKENMRSIFISIMMGILVLVFFIIFRNTILDSLPLYLGFILALLGASFIFIALSIKIGKY